ncbi:MAG: CapA family protein [Oscillospiraceae bacterium]|nr:CapA family protein [Oscillospiraceae bacterium]
MSRKSNHTGLKIVLILLMLVLIAATAFVIKLSLDLAHQPVETRPQTSVTQPVPQTTEAAPEPPAPTETTLPEPEKVIATATISAQGDLLMHKPIFDSRSIVAKSDGSYDFSSIFKYFAETVQSYDYAVANLETTFGGDDFPYQGNPAFNCPDPFLTSVVDAGYDMLLTANNHSYDTRMPGIARTLETVRAAGLGTIGTRLTEEEPRYAIAEVNGIRIGMICYTYSSGLSDDGRPRLNGAGAMENPELANWFHNSNPEKLYTEVEQILAQMEEEGIDASMLFIHWGNEYELTENAHQNRQAQALCDLGIDVIVGGHPHVVQPVELLTATDDPDHQTICVYSLGNAVSNQRHGNIPACPTPHTEDGILFEITFEKYSDGEVYIQWADILPTWVNLHRDNGGNEYNMIPLDMEEKDQWQEKFGFNDEALRKAGASWDRTMDIVGDGLTAIQDHLTQEKADREQYYLDLVNQG